MDLINLIKSLPEELVTSFLIIMLIGGGSCAGYCLFTLHSDNTNRFRTAGRCTTFFGIVGLFIFFSSKLTNPEWIFLFGIITLFGIIFLIIRRINLLK